MTNPLLAIDQFNIELVTENIPLSLAFIIPGVVGVFVFFYIWKNIPKTFSTRIFMSFVMSCSIWQIAEGGLRIAESIELAQFFYQIVSIVIIPTLVFGLHYALLFTKNRKFLLSKWFIYFVYVIGAFFLLTHILRFNDWGLSKSEIWNWQSDSELNLVETLETVWFFVLSITTMFYYAKYALNSRRADPIIKKRSVLLFVGYLIPTFFWIVFQIVPALILGRPDIPLTAPTIIFFSLASLIALKKYRLFSFNPYFVTDKLLEMIEEGVVILDKEMKIRYMNLGFMQLTGYNNVEMLGKSIAELESNNDEESKSIGIEANQDQFLSKNMEATIVSKRNEELTVSYGRSPFYDRNGDNIGSIVVLRDVTESKKINEKIKLEKKQALQYQSMLLSSQLNPHFIFNSLNSVQYYILDENTQPALDYISEFSQLMRSVLQNSLEDYITISEEIGFLELYMNLELKRFQNKFTYSIVMNDDLDPDDLMIPPMLLQPYIENSIIHGLGLTKEGGIITISFSCDGEYIICNIVDNGVGRKKAEELKQIRKATNKHQSHAMGLTKSRIEVLNEIGNHKFFVEVEDLIDLNDTPKGTNISIRFPKIIYE